jgi:hypothetical protein
VWGIVIRDEISERTGGIESGRYAIDIERSLIFPSSNIRRRGIVLKRDIS